VTLHQAANMTMDELRSFVQESKWILAKSMPQTPHEYTLRRDAKDEALFVRVVMCLPRSTFEITRSTSRAD
jgi:hypothetical protein